jgi:lipopolysaccharide biosynthesis glycosyltransferase
MAGSVVVAMSANQNYAAPLAVTMRSICESSDRGRMYSFVVLTSDMDESTRQQMRETIADFGNTTIRFVEVRDIPDMYTGHRELITIEAYYRMLLPRLLPDTEKCVYTDVDVAFMHDVGEFYDTPLYGCPVGAPHESDGYRMWWLREGDVYEYWQKLGVPPESWFFTGSMLLDLSKLRNEGMTDSMVERASTHDYLFHDLDVFNIELRGKVRYVDPRWCVMYDDVPLEPIGDPIVEGQRMALDDPWQIHYAGEMKPWAFDCWKSDIWWSVCSRTPFVEEAKALGARTRRKLGYEIDGGTEGRA